MILKGLCVLFASSFPFMWSLHSDFVFDDSEAILKNEDVSSGSWANAFYHDFWGTDIQSNYSHKSYRPLTVLSFRMNYFLNDKSFSAVHFKITNLILHIFCCFAVWQTFDCIIHDAGFKRRKKWSTDIAFLATLLFAVHPIHVEAVSGIVGRADVLAANTFFLTFLFYKKAMVNKNLQNRILCIVVILAAISMLCKENGVTVLGFCLCYDLVTKFRVNKCNDKKIKTTKEFQSFSYNKYLSFVSSDLIFRILFVAIGIVILLFGRWMVMGGTKPEFKLTDNPAAFSDSLFTKVATYNYLYFLNLLLFIWPQWLCYDWSMGCVPLIENLLDYRMFLICLMYWCGRSVLIAIFSNKVKVKTKRAIILATLLTVVPFLPASNIFYPVGFVVAERILYISSAGYCLLVALGFYKLTKLEKHQKYKKSVIFFGLLLLVFGLKTWQRSEDWRTEYQLFVSGMTVCPLNAKVHYNMAKAADAKGNVDWALSEYKEAIALYEHYYQAMNNLGNLLKDQKSYGDAIYYLKKAVKIKKDFPAAWMNLGIVLANAKRYQESEEAYKTALQYRKNYADCYYNMGNLYLELDQTEQAMDHWLRAVSLYSTHVRAWTNILALLDNTGEYGKALQMIPMVMAAVPDSPSVIFAVANMYGKMDLYNEAETHFRKAIRLFGSQVQAIHYANFGVLYHRWKKYQLAEEMYRNALRIDPTFKSAQTNLESLKKRLK